MREKDAAIALTMKTGHAKTGTRVLECLAYVLLLMTQRARTFLRILQTRTNLSMQ